MKWTLITMLLFVVGVAGVALHRGQDVFVEGLKSGGLSFAKFVPILMIAFLLMGFVDVLLPRDVVEKWLTDGSGWTGLGIAWLAGVLTPGGSIIGMPLAAGLLKAGVGAGVLVTYLTSLACLSLIRVPLEIGFYGWRLMVLRVIASLILPLMAGAIARLVAPWVMGSGAAG